MLKIVESDLRERLFLNLQNVPFCNVENAFLKTWGMPLCQSLYIFLPLLIHSLDSLNSSDLMATNLHDSRQVINKPVFLLG